MARDLSVIVFGATGITGRGVAAYLQKRAETNGFRWAAAGRDPDKVERVLAELGVSAPETIRADVEDQASLHEMASRTKVVLDLVGPYTLHGEPVIEACIAAGAHYMDLSGEIPFVRKMIDAADGRAKEAGVKIVNIAGFEALPADLSVALAAATARERWSEELAAADLDAELPTPGGRMVKLSEVISGGTLQSLAEAVGDEDAALSADSAALVTDPQLAERVRKISPITLAPRLGSQGEVIGPMGPSPFINPAVIQRTAALAAEEEGREFNPFRYREGIAMGGRGATLPLRLAAAGAMSGTQSAVRAITKASPSIRSHASDFLRKRLPGSGFGPQGEAMEEWTWHMATNARTVGGHHVRIDLDADGHPGYLATSRMLGEAGLLLSEDGATPDRSGFLTPAAALGTDQVDRFRHAGMRFQVSS